MTSAAASGTMTMLLGDDITLTGAEAVEYGDAMMMEAAVAEAPHILASLSFTQPISVPMCIVLPLASAAHLADLMMGNAPSVGITELDEIQLSAFGEAISQMMGASANTMSQFLGQPVSFSPPTIVPFSEEALLAHLPEVANQPLVGVRYQMGGAMPAANFYQLSPLSAAEAQIALAAPPPEAPPGVTISAPEPAMAAATPGVSSSPQQASGASASMSNNPTVQQVEFPSFDSHVPATGGINKNLELVMDVALNLTVELGRTELSIKQVLELTRGSVIELNRIAGESVDLYANGKLIAKGEVVVIEDNFGIRITSIVSPADRLRGL